MAPSDLIDNHFGLHEWTTSKSSEIDRELQVQDWGLTIPSSASQRAAEWYIECALIGAETLREAVEIDLGRRGGVPVLKGTGFTLSQTLAELAESKGAVEVAENFDLDLEIVKKMLNGLSLLLEKPYIK